MIKDWQGFLPFFFIFCMKILVFRYNISFIDPPLEEFGEIFSSVIIFAYFPRAKALGKYHHFRKYFAESPSLRVYKWQLYPHLKHMLDHRGNRTYDLCNANSILCQVSYAVRWFECLIFRTSLCNPKWTYINVILNVIIILRACSYASYGQKLSRLSRKHFDQGRIFIFLMEGVRKSLGGGVQLFASAWGVGLVGADRSKLERKKLCIIEKLLNYLKYIRVAKILAINSINSNGQ